MFSQPSIKDIASLYQGNPGALQQRIQKEEQAKPGIPPDLQKLLALQIITSEQDAMKRNQALQQLQQTGQQPTVAQDVEMKAKQALQARMVQEQQKQQGLQSLMQQQKPSGIPEGVPQPQAQPGPQGLDMLSSNIGQNMAGGGIVAFDDGGDVPDPAEDPRIQAIREKIKAAIIARVNELKKTGRAPDHIMGFNGEEDSEVPRPKRQYTLQEQGRDWVERKIAERLAQEEAARRSEESAARIPGESRQAPQGGERVEGSELGRNILNTLSSLPGAGAARAFAGGARGLAAALAGLVGGDRANAPEAPARQQAAPANYADQVPAADMAAFDQASADYMSQRATPAAPRREAPQRPVAAPPAAPAAAPAGLPAAAKVPDDIRQAYTKAMKSGLELDPEAQRKAEAERFRTEVGERPTGGLETLVQELAARRQKIGERADPLRDLLRGTAMAPRGERWMFSGSRGAEYADKAEANREAQMFDLLKQQAEAQGKIEESKYGFKEKAFTIGNEAYKAAYESKRKALEAAGMDVREADRLAKDYAQMASTEAINAANRASQEKIAGMPARASASEERYINEWLKKNPGKSYVDAYEAYKASGAALGADRQTLAELKALQGNLQKQTESLTLSKERRATLEAQLEDVNKRIAQMAGLGGEAASGPVSVTAGGKTYQFPNQAAADKFKAQAGIK